MKKLPIGIQSFEKLIQSDCYYVDKTPFDVLLYLESKVFANYWFETGTPSFLIRLAHARQLSIPDLEHLQASEQLYG